jgi:hypothetical protein
MLLEHKYTLNETQELTLRRARAVNRNLPIRERT